jgi:hypothetical protein
MIKVLTEDISRYPKLFFLSGPIPSEDIPISIAGLPVPHDLRELWNRFGGGEMFESEEILVPTERVEDMLAATDREAIKESGVEGFPFHAGYCLSMALPDQSYVAIGRYEAKLLGRFHSLDEWYVSVLRAEYASRYGLKAVPH